MNWNTVVSVLAVGIPASIVVTLITTFAQRALVRSQEKKTGADAAAVLTETATELLAPLRRELKSTNEELAETRREMTALRRHLGVVEGLLNRAGIPVPEFVWPPAGNGRRSP